MLTCSNIAFQNFSGGGCRIPFFPGGRKARGKRKKGKTAVKGLEKEGEGKDQEKEGRIGRRGTGEVERQREGVRKRKRKGAGQGRVESEPLP